MIYCQLQCKKTRLSLVIMIIFVSLFALSCGGGDSGIVEPTDQSILINWVNPSSALSGEIVSIGYYSSYELVDPKVRISGKLVKATALEGELFFTVPDSATSGLISIQDKTESNRVFFAISPSIKMPQIDDIAVDPETGAQFVFSYVFISMETQYYTMSDAQAVASLVNGTVVGELSAISAYQIEIPARNLDEMVEIADILEADARVDFVMFDGVVETHSATALDFTDHGLPGQRRSNRLVQGRDLYQSKVHPNMPGKIRPTPVKIGVIERGVDFKTADFENYFLDKDKTFNNITIISPDINYSSSSHGTNVTGMIAAEDGNNDRDGGRNAGFLATLHGNHGGFKIKVGNNALFGLTFIGHQIKKIDEFLEQGTRVMNWSFGISLKGTVNRHGDLVDQNVYRKMKFVSYRKAFEKALRGWEKRFPDAIIVVSAGNNANEVTYDTSAPPGIESPLLIVVGGHFYIYSGVALQWSSSAFGEKVDITAASTVRGSKSPLERGTSFAAPTVSAVVAAMLSIDPSLNAEDIRKILRGTASPIDCPVELPNGEESNFTRPLWEDEVGEDASRLGKCAVLNAEGAIRAAIFKATVHEQSAIPIQTSPNNGIATSSSTIVLQWNSSGALKWDLEVLKNGSNYLYDIVTGTPSRTLEDLSPGSYTWRVSACDVTGDHCSGWTEYHSFTIAGAPPSLTIPTQTAPANASTTTATSVTLQWTTGGGSQWPLQVLKDGASHLITTVTGSPSRALTGLTPGSYTWRVGACDSSGGNCSGWTGYRSFTVVGSPVGPVTIPTFNTNYGGNPLLTTRNSLHSMYIHGGQYRLFLLEMNEAGSYPADFHLDLMISTDGKNWNVPINRNVISSTHTNKTFNYYCGEVYESGVYKLWHKATDDWNIRFMDLYHSTSSNGVQFAPHGLVMQHSSYPDNQWGSRNFYILKQGGTYFLYYMVRNSYPGNTRIAVASSDNGYNWVRHGIGVDLGDSGDFDDSHIQFPVVIHDGNRFEMFYYGQDSTNSSSRPGMAISYNGLSWDKLGPITSLPLKGIISGAQKIDGKYRIWYVTRSDYTRYLNYAESD